MSLADDGRRGDDTLTVFTAFTFLTVAVTFFGAASGVLTLRAAVLRVRVLRGVATVIKWWIHLYPVIINAHGSYNTMIVTLWNKKDQFINWYDVSYIWLQFIDYGRISCIIGIWNSPINFQSYSLPKSTTCSTKSCPSLHPSISPSITRARPSTSFGIKS